MRYGNFWVITLIYVLLTVVYSVIGVALAALLSPFGFNAVKCKIGINIILFNSICCVRYHRRNGTRYISGLHLKFQNEPNDNMHWEYIK